MSGKQPEQPAKELLEMEENKSQFIYVLKSIPRLLDEENWTEKEEGIIERHFAYLQKMLAEGKLILVGKTGGLDEKTFGIVIFEADSLHDASSIMNNDPAVAEGIMTADVFPYRVAIMQE